jgi:N-methylhydantoinase B
MNSPTFPAADAVDAVTREVLRNRMEAIANEMQATLLRSAVSVILKEGEDCSCGLFDLDGETIAQACANPLHLGIMGPAVQSIVRAIPVAAMQDGDVYVLNDPYLGGTHLPDVIIAVPIVHEGRVLAISAALAHQEDMGGKSPGSMPADATEVYQEGFIIPPLPLYQRGVRNETLFALLRRNVRLPETLMGDLDAQLASVKVGARGYTQMVREFGEPLVNSTIRSLAQQAATLTRERLREIPDGVYRFHDFIDNDGIQVERRLKIQVALTARAGEVVVDFEGTDPQTAGPLNLGYWGTVSAVYFVLRAFAGPDIPVNSGAAAPIRVRVPEGSLLNPRYPAPVAIRAHTAKRVVDAVFGALARALPERVMAASAGSMSVCSFGGLDARSGKRFGCTDIVAGGMGARPDKDGIDLVETDITNCMNIPVEAFEAHYPLRLHATRYRADSGGPGEFRGGLGVERIIEALDGPIRCSFRSDRHFTAPWGLRGGLAGQCWQTQVERADGRAEPVPSKAVFTLQRGDRLVMRTGGGGGFGDPLRRATSAVLDDVIDGKVSAASARQRYGVVVDEARWQVDDHATQGLRAAMAAERGPVSWLFDRGNGVRD